MVDPELYSSRERSTNVELVRELVYPADDEAFAAASRRFADHFHPSVLAELDWFEQTRPEEQRERAASHVDGLFGMSLLLNLECRRARFEADLDDLRGWRRHERFFDLYWGHPEVREAMGATIVDALAEASDRPPPSWSHRLDVELPPGATAIHVSVAVANLVYELLDHPVYRLDAKAFVRTLTSAHGPWFGLPGGCPDDPTLAARQLDWMHDVAGMARASGLPEFAEPVEAVAGRMAAGEFAEGKADARYYEGAGGCGRCSMNFASSALRYLDANWDELRAWGQGITYIAADLNTSTCPFCGYRARIEVPTLFYARDRAQVVYCVPTRGIGREEAVDFYREMITGIRDDIVSGMTDEERRAFDSASELVTYDADEFLRVIQMGETVDEEHVFNAVRLADGQGMLIDMAKGFVREMTKEEMDELEASPYYLTVDEARERWGEP